MTKREIKEIAQDELLDAASRAFYVVEAGLEVNGRTLTEKEATLIREEMENQLLRIARFFAR